MADNLNEKGDITTVADIKNLVHTFYDKVRTDDRDFAFTD